MWQRSLGKYSITLLLLKICCRVLFISLHIYIGRGIKWQIAWQMKQSTLCLLVLSWMKRSCQGEQKEHPSWTDLDCQILEFYKFLQAKGINCIFSIFISS